jgi:multiple sugar transport system ATP-binding protein
MAHPRATRAVALQSPISHSSKAAEAESGVLDPLLMPARRSTISAPGRDARTGPVRVRFVGRMHGPAMTSHGWIEECTGMSTVTFDHVYKRYGDVVAVQDLNLEIQDGEFMVLVGPSGCGKTTSLRMIAGLEEISEGTLRIGDRVVNDVPPKDRDIAMVFQSYALYPHMTVRDNLAFGLKLRKVAKQDIERRVSDAAGILDLGRLLDRKPKELSGGQRQRVALGRAIVREPAVFLMDEPLSNLDAKLRVQTRAEIARLHQRLKTTIVYVTHDQVEAMTMGSRIAVMSEGLLQQVGTPQQLYDHPINRFVAGFIGSPAMNFVDVNVDGSGDGAKLSSAEGIEIPLPPRFREAVGQASSRNLVAGFRPEHLEIGNGDGAGTGARLRATADVVEYLGNEELLHVTAGGRDIVAIVDSEHRVKPGDVLDFRVPLEKVHLFDPESGSSLVASRN